MQFQVSRNGQTYGPYTLEDLQRYVASGNVLPSDLAKSEAMPDWLPVSQILSQQTASAPASSPAPGDPQAAPQYPSGVAPATPTDPAAQTYPAQTYPAQPYPAVQPYPAAQTSPAPYQPSPFQSPAPYAPNPAVIAASRYPDPPSLHWGLVLLISLFTNGLFQIIWDFIQSAWLKKVQPDATALTKYITAYALVVGGVIVAVIGGVVLAASSQNGSSVSPVGVILVILGFLGYIGGFIMLIVARFSERASLEQHFNGPEPVGLQLSGIMTFFFGSLYFQYHLTRIHELKQAARMGVPAVY